MALIKCSECGKEISDKAKICVNCGKKIQQNYFKKIMLAIIVLAVLFILFIFTMNYLNSNSNNDNYYEETYQVEGVYKADNGFTLMLSSNGTCTLSNPDFKIDKDLLSVYTSACNWSESNKNVYINYTTTVTTIYGQTVNTQDDMSGVFTGTSIQINDGANYIKQ